MTAALPSLSDEALALQTQSGSLEAFEELLLRYEQRIFSFVSQSCRNRIDAAEITQDTFVKAFQAIGQFDPTRTFAPWLFTIARRKCSDYFRSLKDCSHQPTPESPPEHESASQLLDNTDPAELLARQDERRILWIVSRRVLPEAQFDALWLRYVEDMSVAEIANVLRRPQTYVKVLLFRARKTLAQKLKRTCTEAEIPVGNDAAFLRAKSLPSAYEIIVR